MKKSTLSLALEIKDIKALRYINKRERAQKEILIRKFGEYRIGLLSESTQERPAFWSGGERHPTPLCFSRPG